MYYLRSKAAAEPIKFTLSSKYQQKYVPQSNTNATVVTTNSFEVQSEIIPEQNAANTEEGLACSLDNPDECLMCGS
jgi:ribonucleoside-diphosphate reductase alpha chain